MSLAYIKQIFLNLVDNFTNFFKYNPVIKGFVAIWFYFAGIHVYIYCVLALLIFDVITGIIASIKKGKGFTTRHLRKGLIEKLVLYLILILASTAIELILKSIFPWEKYFIVCLVAILISTYEMISICENILSINPELYFLKNIIKISNSLSDKTLKAAEKRIDKLTETEGKSEEGK